MTFTKWLIGMIGMAATASAQQTPPDITPATAQQIVQEVGVRGNMASVRSFDLRTIGLRGTPLLLPGWTPGEVVFINNKTISDVKFKYDVPSQLLLILRKGTDSTMTDGRNIKTLTLQTANGTQHYVFLPYQASPAEPTPVGGLARIVGGAAYSLVQLPVKILDKAPPRSPYGENRDYDEFRDEPVYFLLGPNGKREKVKLTKKSLATALGDKADAFGKYLKENRLDVSNEADVAKALAEMK